MERLALNPARRGGAWLLALSVAAAVALAAPAAATAARECFLLTDCTSVTGPWVVIPAAVRTPSTAGASISCPDDGQLALGADYDLSGGGSPPPFVNRFLAGPGNGLVTGGNAPFFAVTFTDAVGSFRPRLGCVPEQDRAARLAAAAQRRARDVVRTREVRLRPSRAVRRVHRCAKGERLRHSAAGVLFHRRRPPAPDELRDTTVGRQMAGGQIRVRVRTGPTVGDRERVTLQILAVCRR